MTATVLTVENRKGGVAKTTTAVTLGVGLAKRLHEVGDGRVLIIDMDPQGDSARGLGLDAGNRCVSHVLESGGDVATLRANVIWADQSQNEGPARPNLFVLPASDRLSDAKEDILTEFALLAARSMRGRQQGDARQLVNVLNERLGLAKQAFDYIIIDCPPTLDMLQQAIHQFADAAIVPVKVDFHGASATGRHTSNIINDQSEGIDITIRAIVPTFYDSRLRLTKSMMENIYKVYGRKIVSTPIPNTVKIAEAPASGGQTILEYAPTSAAAKAYWDLVDLVYSEG
jgi:chromosome partitioning protein